MYAKLKSTVKPGSGFMFWGCVADNSRGNTAREGGRIDSCTYQKILRDTGFYNRIHPTYEFNMEAKCKYILL